MLGLGLAVVGAAIDMQVQDKLGTLFQGCYLAGAVAAVCWVRRKNLFAPMVQPPLVLAVTVPGVVLYASGMPGDTDTMARILAVSNPLINGFPTMAVTTAITVLIGLFRIIRERDPEAAGQRAPRTTTAPSRPRPSRDSTAIPKRAADPAPPAGRRRAAEGGPVPRRAQHAQRTEGELPRWPVREGTPPPAQRARRALGDQPPPPPPIRKPPPPRGRPWDIEDGR